MNQQLSEWQHDADYHGGQAFGSFTLYRSRKLLLEDGRPVRIGSRAFALLEALVARAGELLSREQLEAAAWPRSIVEETSLRVHMSALRRVLGDTPGGARYIVNIPGRGYCFVMKVVRVGAPPHAVAGLGTGIGMNLGAPAVAGIGTGFRLQSPPDGRAAPTPRAADGAATRINAAPMPQRLGKPIGRAGVVAALAAQVAQRRLVTLVGPGGIGKTTVALAVAEAVRARFADGVCFVDLAPLCDAELVPAAVAGALGLALAVDAPLPALCAALGTRALLVVLDNCEHLIDATAQLAEALLQACADVHLVATSREPLYTDGECVHYLAALGAPLVVGLHVTQALAYPAVQLFVERARGNDSSFVLDEANVDDVCLLCRQLDGIPLALELAAARVDGLGAAGLAARLGDVFGLLTRGRRTALPRHRTLEALMNWSHDMLGEHEQLVLRRCAVFRAGFSLDAAAAVCACARVPPARVVDALLALAAKSLVGLERDGSSARYRLLHITRAYAAGKLAASGEGQALSARHAAHVRALLAADARDARGVPAQLWIAAHGRNTDDVRAALDWAMSAGGDFALGIELTTESVHIAYAMGLQDECRARVKSALAELARLPQRRPDLEISLACTYAFLCCQTPLDSEEQAALFARMGALIPQADSPDQRILALHSLCVVAFGLGDYPAVRRHVEHIAALAGQALNPGNAELIARFRVMTLHKLGQHAEASQLARGLLARAPADRGNHLAGAVPLGVSMRIWLARMAWLEGRPGQAALLAHEAVAHAEGEHPLALCQALAQAALPVALWRGDDAHAARLTARLDAHAARHGLEYWLAWAHGFAQVLARRAQAREHARADADAHSHARTQAHLDADATPWRPPTNAMQADLLGTLDETMVSALTLARVEAGTVLWCAPEIWRAHGEQLLRRDGARALLTAQALFEQALALARSQQALAWQLRTAVSLARLWASTVQADEGRALLASVLASFTEGQDTADLLAARRLLDTLPSSPPHITKARDD